MPSMYSGLLVSTAATFKLDPDLLFAQVLVESGDSPWAWKPEPLYRYFWDVQLQRPFRTLTAIEIMTEAPPKDFPTLAGDPTQEWWAQQASWGLMQILGAVARQQGFSGAYLSQLCDPAINLAIGCKHLAALLFWAKGNVAQALAAYNGGMGGNSTPPYRNQAYADRVFLMRKSLIGGTA